VKLKDSNRLKLTDTDSKNLELQSNLKAIGLLAYRTLPTAYDSWESDANENLNRLVRQYFPKKTNFDDIDEQAVKVAKNILHNRPRKRYRYLSPSEVLVKALDNNGIVAFIA
jgi:IS30 family transposase